MIRLLFHPVFGRLFAAQVVALVGTGLLTVALALLAWDLAGDKAAQVLGTAYAIKMLAYVGLAPLGTALLAQAPRRAVLIGADLIRGAVALALPFVTEVWQVYLAIFALQAASAVFTPTFQATIPDVLPDEAAYTRALSLSRIAYETENIASPALAGALLALISFHWLFAGTVAGFVASALLIRSCTLPARSAAPLQPFRSRLTRGAHVYLATPRLRGLLALTLTAAAASAIVIVDTVVLVRDRFAGSESDVALALAVYGAGSVVAALLLPGILTRAGDRPVMLAGAAGLVLLMLAQGVWHLAGGPGWGAFLAFWGLFGLAYGAVLTPGGRLLRRSADAADRPALFTAQFALSHLCWLLCYPVAGVALTALGPAAPFLLLGLIGLAGLAAAGRVWPAGSDAALPHSHPDLPPDHPHLQGHSGPRHAHPVMIDAEHKVWPTYG